MIYPAHILCNENFKVQSVEEHCQNTAKIASECLRCVNLDNVGYLAGIVHDMGKYTSEFKEYLENAVMKNTIKTKKVIHTHAATRFFIEEFHNKEMFSSFEDMTAEILAYASGAHHGLYDCFDKKNKCGFSHRLDYDDQIYQFAKKQFTEYCVNNHELKNLFSKAHKQLMPVYNWINSQIDDENKDLHFYLGLLTRLVLSSVIHGDREDTASFMSNIKSNEIDYINIWEKFLKQVEKKLEKFPSDTPIEKARRKISEKCKESAEFSSGVYRLNVPTGAGKTLSSLRYALTHAAKYQKSRIIFTSPLLSILEQNAAVLRDFIGDDDLILEHHSNIIREKSEFGELDTHELMAESWNAPIIITTLVQLLNTLFSGKTSCIRRFQALCNCILVIDEVQTVPNKMLTLFNLAVNFLSKVCNATIILCSATQPALEQATHPILDGLTELVPYDEDIWKTFKRTNIINAGDMCLDEIPNFIYEKIEQTNSLLMVCNKKQQASYIYNQMKDSEISCFHLSAAMCPEHRRDILSKLENTLKNKKQTKVLCVSTQIIEAGVDISFDCVIRMIAGMDNAVQTAGRCNRNGEYQGIAPVYLINCIDENLGMLKEIESAKTATKALISEFNKNPDKFNNDLASDESIALYYRYLYGAMNNGAQDYICDDKISIFDLLSTNEKYAIKSDKYNLFGLKQAFALAGEKFKVFSEETTDILVPYKEGNDLITELCSSSIKYKFDVQKKALDKAKQYTISVYQFQLKKLEEYKALISLFDGAVLALDSSFYDLETGLISEQGNMDYLEV